MMSMLYRHITTFAIFLYKVIFVGPYLEKGSYSPILGKVVSCTKLYPIIRKNNLDLTRPLMCTWKSDIEVSCNRFLTRDCHSRHCCPDHGWSGARRWTFLASSQRRKRMTCPSTRPSGRASASRSTSATHARKCLLFWR